MKTKVCPICDQPIQGNFCKGCKKIIWKPAEQNITYYLNTRHPEKETDCSYHNNSSIGSGELNHDKQWEGSETVRSAPHRMTEAETEAKKAEIKRRMELRKQGMQNPAIKKIMIGLVVYLVVCFGGIFGRVFFSIFGGF